LAISVLVLFAVLFVLGWVWYSVSTDVKEVAAEEAVAAEQLKDEEDKAA
jgi:cbb3-type cytochrome oxidase subunit 3